MFENILELEVGDFYGFLNNFLDGLCYFWYIFFQYGNYILFAVFIIMGIILYKSAKEKEYDEKVHGKEEFVKKRGRAGSAVCIFLAFGFVSGHLTSFLLDVFRSFPEPELLLRYVGDTLVSINSLEELHLLNLYERTIYLANSFLSFVSFLLISISIYLILFNKFIIRSKLKYITFLCFGFFIWLSSGFEASFRLLV